MLPSLARLLLAASIPAISQDCVPTFFNSEPRDADWFYASGQGRDAQEARRDAVRSLFAKATGGENLPAEILAGWEQDDHGECRGRHYALVRIEQAAVKRNKAALAAPRKEAPVRAKAPAIPLAELLSRLGKPERGPVVVNTSVQVSAPQPPAAQKDTDLKYVVVLAAFLAFIAACLFLARSRQAPASPVQSPPPPPPAPPRPPPAREGPRVYRADFRRALSDSEGGSAGAVRVGSKAYRLLGRIARGESSDVFLAERDCALGERVVIKVQRARDDADLLRRERGILQALAESGEQGTPYFSLRVPQLVDIGELAPSGDPVPLALVLRHPAGFIETLRGVAAAHPQGLDARHGVWIWRRLLEVLGWAHRSGFAHGAILPQHLLVNAKDHGVMLSGWSCAGLQGRALPALAAGCEDFYLPEARSGGPLSAFADLAMAARCVAFALSGGPIAVPASTPRPIAQLLEPYVRGSAESAPAADADSLNDAVARAAKEAYGAPRFVPLETPAWARAASGRMNHGIR
jgi:hypothetical protein